MNTNQIPFEFMNQVPITHVFVNINDKRGSVMQWLS